MTGINKFIKSI